MIEGKDIAHRKRRGVLIKWANNAVRLLAARKSADTWAEEAQTEGY